MKFKTIPDEYFTVILDRLSRFEPSYIKYERVFNDIISRFIVGLNNKAALSVENKIEIVKDAVNASVSNSETTEKFSKFLLCLEDKYFNYNTLSNKYLSAGLNFEGMLNKVDISALPLNISIFNSILKVNNIEELYELRKQKSLLYPVEKILLCEGQTEYLLLNSIANTVGFDFNKHGILIVQAGGKNQVAKKYYELVEYCRLPLFVLLDKDGLEISKLIENKLRQKDMIYLISSGEFEDLIPVEILMNTINHVHKNEIPCSAVDFAYSSSMVLNLEEIYRKYGFGEFKKAHFALQLRDYIDKNSNNIDFNSSEIVNIIQTLQAL